TITEHIRLQFWYTSTGTLWLDNVRLGPCEPIRKRFTDVIPPSTAVNLLPNSSFECGTAGWGSIADLPGWGGNLNQLVGAVDDANAKFHKSSFKIALTPENIPIYYFDYFPLYRVPVKAPLLANIGWISVEPGTQYTLSAYMKANSQDLVGVLSIRQALGQSLRRQVQLETDWQRHVFTFRPQAEQIFVALGLDLEASKKEAGTLWIDAAQLEKGSQASPYQPRATVEVGLETNRLGNLFPYGDEPKMTATVFNTGEVAKSTVLHVRTTDFDDATVYESTVPVDIPPGRTARVSIPTGVQRKGFYRLHLRGEGAEVVLTRPMRFAITEPYTGSDSLFGMNHAYPWPHLLGLSKQIGLCWFRDWSLKWHDVEPQKGRFDFTQCDYQIDRVLQRGLKVLPLLPFPSSNWSSSAGPEVKVTEDYPAGRERIAYMPRDVNDFAAYVRKTVEHYKERLGVWEILNEPIYTSYALPRSKGYQVKDYVQLLRAAYQAVKTVDPDALVIGGIAGHPTTYTKEFIEIGGLRWVDALNLHAYPGLASPEAHEESLRLLREQMRSPEVARPSWPCFHGLEARATDKPIWFTEGAYYADDDKPLEPYDSTWLKTVDSEIEAAECQVKFNALLLAYGAEKIIYHSGTPGSLNNEELSGIFFEWAGAPRKMLVTQAAMANLLSPKVRSLGSLPGPEKVKVYGFTAGGRTVIIAWAEEGAQPRPIYLSGKPWRAVDLQGNELKVDSVVLTGRPIYFVAEGTSLQELPW
ncbi:MAG: endo-1,4-beta-xylanase, partial [Sedimentisphaerales bacterium]|nr:endo-1,4-beta-xylanase [Sedimentisphaerales bacterium]